MSVVGASGSGKTTLVQKLLKYPEIYFNNKPSIIQWFYGEVKPSINQRNVTYIKGLPKSDEILENSIIVLDDLFIEARNDCDITNLFTRVAHHKNSFIIFLTQNLFHTSSQNRTRNLNTHYLIIFKNPRDTLQVRTLASQTGYKFLVDVFREATSDGPHKYLLLDFRQETPEVLRIRSNILIGEEQFAYVSEDVYKQLFV